MSFLAQFLMAAFLSLYAGSCPAVYAELFRGFVFRLLPAEEGLDDAHVAAAARAWMLGLAEGQKIFFEAKVDPRRGKRSAENLKTVPHQNLVPTIEANMYAADVLRNDRLVAIVLVVATVLVVAALGFDFMAPLLLNS
jgi:CspA family cold shock protein